MTRLFYKFFSPKEGDGTDSEKESKESPDKEEQEDEEDTSENEDTEEEQDDNEEVEDDEEGEEGEDGIASKYFSDPNSIPKQLRADFKKMQGIFTRKMQQVSAVAARAEAFDLLVQDSDFQEWAEAKKAGTLKSLKSNRSKSASDDDEDDDEDTPVTKGDLAKLMQRIDSKESLSRQERDLEIEFKQFEKDYPDYRLYKEPMKDIFSRYPKMSYVDAYDLARSKELASTSKKDTMKAKKNANINKPNRTGAKEGEQKKGKMKFWDAYEMAKKALNKR